MTRRMTRRASGGRWRSGGLLFLIAGLQVISASVFVEDIVSAVFGLRSTPDSWSWREAIEISATIGLLLGMALSVIVIRNLLRQRRRDAERLRAASAAFYDVVQEQFDDWGLTPSERDVAMFMLKGLSNQEIAAIRETSEGTIKAQSTAVFRKSGSTGRAQLFSFFIEELLAPADPADFAGRNRSDAA